MNLFSHVNSLAALKKLCLALLACVLLQALALVMLTNKLSGVHDRIVIVPPGLSGPVAVDWARADAEYIKDFALFVATLIGSITPQNGEYIADRLSRMTHPAAYGPIRQAILASAKDPALLNSGSSSSFVVRDVVHEAQTGLTFVVGETQLYAGNGQPRIERTVYEMRIAIVEGRPVVQSLINYPGWEPHTLAWKEKNKGKEGAAP